MNSNLRIALILPKDDFGEHLRKLLEEQFAKRELSFVFCSFSEKDLHRENARICSCDIGIAYGDSASKWVSDCMRDVPFLLMSAADIENMSELHLKAYPSATTMGVLLAKLSDKLVKIVKPKQYSICALFEKSEAGRVCRMAYEDSVCQFKGTGDALAPRIGFFNQNNTREIKKLVNKLTDELLPQSFICVYGFSTSGPGYEYLLTEIQRRCDDHPNWHILTDVNAPSTIRPSGAVCGVESGVPLIGIAFFSRLLCALVEMLIKATLWSGNVRSENIKRAIIENGRFARTSMGALTFYNGELLIPFGCCLPNGELLEIDKFRKIDDVRESIALSMSRIEDISTDIVKTRLPEFEKQILRYKKRVIDEILKPCFCAQKVYFIDEDVDVLNDSFPVKMPYGFPMKPGIIQVSYNDRDIENTDVSQLYVLKADKRVAPITHAWELDDQLIDAVLLGTDVHDAENRAKSKDFLLSAKDALKFVHDILLANDYKNNYLYYICTGRGNNNTTKGIAFFSANKFRNVELSTLKNVAERFWGAVYTLVRLKQIQIASLKSAIGSIMSRNGSHNIGSHVLAALSHNVGTMPDDRVLYQYIQHRMDYIATATTEQPLWRQPTMFVSTMMKEFLRQQHLLDYISRSEGLKAYRFQGQNFDEEQRGSIRIHVRRLERGLPRNVVADFIFGNDENAFFHDVSVAIPGGVIGQHAIYTIIENTLRNAAKHEWSEAVRRWRIARDVLGNANDLQSDLDDFEPKHLDVYVDFVDDPEAMKVHCSIWNARVVKDSVRARIGALVLSVWLGNYHVEGLEATVYDESKLGIVADILLCAAENLISRKNAVGDFVLSEIVKCVRLHLQSERHAAVVEILKDETKRVKLQPDVLEPFLLAAVKQEAWAIRKRLREKIVASFLDESGGLRKENWGIAEMRISAGFLRGASIEDIGGLSTPKAILSLIRPRVIKADGENCIGYEFDFDKPKELLVVLKPSRHKDFPNQKNGRQDETLAKANRNAKKFGIVFMRSDEALKEKSFPYSYVLFESLDVDAAHAWNCRSLCLPFRVLACEKHSADAAGSTALGVWDRVNDFVPLFKGYFGGNGDRVVEEIRKIAGGTAAQELCSQLLEDTYASWLDHVRRHCFGDGVRPVIALDLAKDDNASGAGKSLLSNVELMRYVFQHSFNSAARSYLAQSRATKFSADFVTALQAVVEMKYRQVNSLRELARIGYGRDDDGQVTDADLNRLSEDLNSLSTVQMYCWFLCLMQKGDLKIGNVKSFDAWYIGVRGEVKGFAQYLCSIIKDQADAFLRRYEERIETLPVNFKSKESTKLPSWQWRRVDDDGVFLDVRVVNRDDVRLAHADRHDICYFRHGDKNFPEIGVSYYEPLSGAQGELNALMAFQGDLALLQGTAKTGMTEARVRVVRQATQLVENACSRVLIIDERVKEFMETHREVRNLIGGLGIAVADDRDADVRLMFDDMSTATNRSGGAVFNGLSLSKFEIVIVHQGIIDKLLPGHEDPEVVEIWLNKLIGEGMLHYVVITTGRGSPANIPETARVLPYSIIESTILQRYPEKMVLVDAIMNILPVKSETTSKVYGGEK